MKKSVAKFKNCGNKTGIKIIIFKSLKNLLPMKEKIFEAIKEVACDILGDVEIKKDANLQSDLGLESLDQIELIMQVENKLSIRLNDDGPYETVEELINAFYNEMSK